MGILNSETDRLRKQISDLKFERERLRAALRFIADYEGSLDGNSAYIEMKRRAQDVLRGNEQ